ncbi:GIN domain-containing protein [Flagellimonas myxillae]|uniref:GIN domain-containing protein n=1 Tax=Flagellimonas myxillae TaxID=2942214 RepID=UPI00201F35E9|nr:DUF2807 domain-containing protein [Muricauda myxillae]MCL6265572.1 DUF2807 domain-containing protein [Muricauda myxillae]
MKKSKLLLVGAIISIFIFILIFQLVVHQNVKDVKANKKPMQILSKKLELSDFTSLAVAGRFHIYYEQSEEQSVQIEAPDYHLDSVVTKVSNKVLEIHSGLGLQKKDSVVIYISGKALDSLALMLSPHFETTNQISGRRLYLDFGGNSSAKLNLNYDTLIYKNTSLGSIQLKGEITNIELIEDR